VRGLTLKFLKAVRKTIVLVNYIVSLFTHKFLFIETVRASSPLKSAWIRKFKQNSDDLGFVYFDVYPNTLNVKSIGQNSYSSNAIVAIMQPETTIEIGKWVVMSRDIKFIQTNTHKISNVSTHPKLYSGAICSNIKIGNDVFIGYGAILMFGEKGLSVGDGAVIGAGSIVTHDIEPYAIYAGAPAKFIKWRFDKKTRETLLKIRWWDMPDKLIMKNKHLFSDPKEFCKEFKDIRTEETSRRGS
jgi:acetyltransferase-like isoleucine patch superfamily enzyme